MADYFQNNLDGTPWNSARTKTAFSTRPGLALQLDSGILSLLAPPNPPTVLASAPLSQVTVKVGGAAKVGAGVLLNFGENAWMVDFSKVPSRTRAQSGTENMVKRFFGMGAMADLKQGRVLRDGFVRAMTARGAKLADNK